MSSRSKSIAEIQTWLDGKPLNGAPSTETFMRQGKLAQEATVDQGADTIYPPSEVAPAPPGAIPLSKEELAVRKEQEHQESLQRAQDRHDAFLDRTE